MKTIASLLAVSATILVLTTAPALRAGPPPNYPARVQSTAVKSPQTVASAKTDARQTASVCGADQGCACAQAMGMKAHS